jgi:hypothetical protein
MLSLSAAADAEVLGVRLRAVVDEFSPVVPTIAAYAASPSSVVRNSSGRAASIWTF